MLQAKGRPQVAKRWGRSAPRVRHGLSATWTATRLGRDGMDPVALLPGGVQREPLWPAVLVGSDACVRLPGRRGAPPPTCTGRRHRSRATAPMPEVCSKDNGARRECPRLAALRA